MSTQNNKKQDIGALWARSFSGGEFLSGKITIDGKTTELVIFPNQYKSENEKAPDWRIYESEPRNTTASPTKTAPKAKTVVRKPTRPSPATEPEEDENVAF